MLSYDIAKQFVESPDPPFPEKLPFQEFQIVFPYGIFVSKNSLRENIQEDHPEMDFFQANMLAVEMMEMEYYCNVRRKKELHFNLFSGFEEDDDFVFRLNLENSQITVTVNEITPDDEALVKALVYRMLRIVAYTVDYLNRPTEVVETETMATSGRARSSGKYSRRSSTIYITKKKYQRRQEKSSREYERHTDSWQVRGHWRRYRDESGEVIKKVWIEPHTRGPGKKKKRPDDKTYKIRRDKRV